MTGNASSGSPAWVVVQETPLEFNLPDYLHWLYLAAKPCVLFCFSSLLFKARMPQYRIRYCGKIAMYLIQRIQHVRAKWQRRTKVECHLLLPNEFIYNPDLSIIGQKDNQFNYQGVVHS